MGEHNNEALIRGTKAIARQAEVEGRYHKRGEA